MVKKGMVKTEEEIAIIREGGKRLARILLTLKEAVRPGVTTLELDTLAEKLVRDEGDTPAFLNYTPEGADSPYPGTLCVSVNDEVVHGIRGKRVLLEGDIITLDMGIEHGGFFTDAAITVPVGAVPKIAQKLMDVTQKALNVGISVAQAGNTIGDIGYAIEKYVNKNGFVVVEELGGHGVGYHQHEDPHIPNYGEKGEGIELVPGMVLALEPIVNEGTRFVKMLSDGYTFVTKDHKRSAHFEHTILITNGEPEILTKI